MNCLGLLVTVVTITCISTSTILNDFGNLGTVEYNRQDKVRWQPDGSLVFSLLYKIPPFNGKKIKDITFDDCTTIKYLYKSSKSGVYTIHPNGGNEQLVYCDMMTDGGGWTVFQRRYDGSVDFVNRKWSDFKNGFGKVSGEHWLGNELIHKITSQGVYELRFELGDFESNYRHAVYTNFKLQSEHHGYRLTYDKFDYGNAGDSLKMAKNMKFTTKDKDQDIDSRNCATVDNHPGAWWHANCFRAHLNGLYNKTPKITEWKGIIWNTWKGSKYSLRSTKIMVRRVLKAS